MVGFIPGFGGGGKTESAPMIIPTPEPPAITPETNPEVAAAADRERRSRSPGRSSNILTSPLGTANDIDSTRKKLTLG